MEDSVQIKKFEFSDIPQFGDLCDDSEWYSPQLKRQQGLCYAIKSTGIIALSHMREQSLSVLYMAEFSAIPCTRSLCL